MQTYKPEWHNLRHKLLHQTMRDKECTLDIEQDYPIVLKQDSTEHSLCVINPDKPEMIGHLNYWPRTLVDQTDQNTTQIALIGNVCTARSWQGTGVQQALFKSLENLFENQNIASGVLWTSIPDFFKRFGFEPAGAEQHYSLSANAFCHLNPENQVFTIQPNSIDAEALHRSFLELRPKTPLALKRTAIENQTLLNIPDTYLFATESQSKIDAFAILGRGSDFIAVIHEWGFSNPHSFAQIIAHIFRVTCWNNLKIISPQKLNDFHLSFFQAYQAHPNQTAMAMAKNSPQQKIQIPWHDCFIWGLDSI